MGEMDYVFIRQELHFRSSEQPPVHLANFRTILFSVLTIELENFEAQILSVSGKFHGLLYSAWQRFKALINYSFFSHATNIY